MEGLIFRILGYLCPAFFPYQTGKIPHLPVASRFNRRH